MSEDWDADRIARECAEAARAKARKGAIPMPPETGTRHEDDPPMRDAVGKFVPGHKSCGGRKKGSGSKYKPKYLKRITRWAAAGATMAEIAEWLDVSQRALFRWQQDIPEVATAIRIGRQPCISRSERSLYDRANGYTYVEQQAIKVRDGKDSDTVVIVEVEKHMPPDMQALAFFLANKDPENWKLKRTVEHTGQVEHVPVDQARRELEEFYRGGGEGIIDASFEDVTPALPAPESEEAGAISPASP